MEFGRSRTIALALASAALWGLWWMPVRALDWAGMGGLWATFGMTLGSALALLWAARGAPALPRRALAGALLVGLGVMLYGVALAFTDIVRAVLLFYPALCVFLLFEPLGILGIWLRVKRYFMAWPFRY